MPLPVFPPSLLPPGHLTSETTAVGRGFLAHASLISRQHGGLSQRASPFGCSLVELGGGSGGCDLCCRTTDPTNRAAKPKKGGEPAAAEWRTFPEAGRVSMAEPLGTGELRKMGTQG